MTSPSIHILCASSENVPRIKFLIHKHEFLQLPSFLSISFSSLWAMRQGLKLSTLFEIFLQYFSHHLFSFRILCSSSHATDTPAHLTGCIRWAGSPSFLENHGCWGWEVFAGGCGSEQSPWFLHPPVPVCTPPLKLWGPTASPDTAKCSLGAELPLMGNHCPELFQGRTWTCPSLLRWQKHSTAVRWGSQ